jgi:hypothetical protein
MRFDPTNRRVFLQGAGGALLALPFLPSLLPRPLWRRAEAAPPAIPRRFIAIKTYNGTPLRAFYPGSQPGYGTHSGDDRIRLTQPLAEATGRHSDGNQYYGHWAPLSDFSANGVSQVFNPSFNRHHDNMLLLRGMDLMPDLNHNHGAILGNFGLRTNGVGGVLPGAQINVTIDQIMARSPNVYASAPLGPRILHLGSRTNTFSYAPSNPSQLLATGRNAVQQAQAFTNPRTAFDAVMNGVPSDDPGVPTEPPSVGARLVDRVLEDYRRASNRPHLSAADRQRLDQHLTRLSELEARVAVDPGEGGSGGGGCQVPPAPPSIDTGGEFNADVGEITDLFQRMVDLIVLAFSCDVTRIATLDITKMVINEGGGFGMGDSENANSAGRENWHFQAHAWDANAIRWLTLGAEWVAQQVILRLLDEMDGTPQADGESLLHHSTVIWGNELSFNHLSYSLPTALWGRAGGFLGTGRYIDYINHDRPVRFRQHDGPVIEGVQYNRFMVTLLQAMGVQPSEYELSPGDGFGEWRTVDKNDLWAIDYDDSKRGDILPSIRG